MTQISRDQIFAHGKRVFSVADLGAIIRKARKQQGYTQEQVADALGCSPRLLGEIERGRGTAAFDTVANYALQMGIDLLAFDRTEE